MEPLPIWVKNMEKREIDLKIQKKELRKEIGRLRRAHTDEEIHKMSLLSLACSSFSSSLSPSAFER